MHLRFTLWLLSSFFSILCFASAPSTPPTNFSANSAEGNRITFSFTIGDGARRIIIARAGSAVTATPSDGIDYNYDTSFGEGDEIAADEFVVYDGTSSAVSIYAFQPATTYHFRIFEYNGSGATTEYLLTPLEGMAATLSAPNVQASGLTISNTTGSSMDLSWTRGNGDRSIVLIKAGSPVDANPSDLTSYTPSPSFGSGSLIGTGNRVVYAGSSNSATIFKLQPGITYHIAVFEYNGSSGPVYLVPGHTANVTTATTPSVPASGISFNAVDGNRFNINWTTGDGARRLIIGSAAGPVSAVPVDGQDYVASSTFGNGEEITPGEFVVYNGTSSAVTLYGLTPQQTYYFKIFEYNGTAGGNTYYLIAAAPEGSQATADPPTSNASGFSFSNITGTELTMTWTPGDGAQRLVLAREGSPVDYTPSDLETFSANQNFSTAGSVGNDNKVLYRGTGSSLDVTGLEPGLTYYFSVFEFNGSSGPVYLTPGASSMQMTDDSPPDVAASNLNFYTIEGNRFNISWANGNGSRRIVVVNTGSPVTAVPVDGMDYNSNATLGNGDDLGGGQYVVYDGTGASMTLWGLAAATTYHVRIYEYFGTGSNTIYQTGLYGEDSQATLSPPTTSATMSFSSITGNSMQVNFNGGDGERRLVVVKADSPVDNAPNNFTRYFGYPLGSSSGHLGGGNYVVYAGSGNSFTLNGLSPGVTYYFKTFEYNGINGPVYENNPPDFSQATLSVPPTVQAGNLNFTNIGATEVRLNWTNGNGSRRIILARAINAVDEIPADNTDYTPDATFGSGQEIGSGNFVVYDGTGTGTTIYGLALETEYHFAIFEYNGTGANAYYLSPGASASQATISPPTLAPSNLTASDVSSTATQVGWTNGNGVGRLVIVSEGAPLNMNPIPGQTYNTSSFFPSGSATPIGNGKAVYLGTSTNVTVSGLTSGTTYYYSIFEYSGVSQSPNYLLSAGVIMHTTPGPPQTPAVDLMTNSIDGASVSISWTPGSGQKRLVVIREAGTTASTPTDGNDYTPNSAFGAGSELGSGNFIVYEGGGNSTLITNLDPSTTYHLEVYEFNFENSGTRYLLSNPASLTFATTVLPVECISFEGQVEDAGALLEWSTATELNNAGFSLQRSTDGINFSEIAWIPGRGTTTEVTDYRRQDTQVHGGQTYYYRLIQQDWDGQWEQACQMISLQLPESKVPALTTAPNPFREQLTVRFALPEKSQVHLSIYDSQGQLLWDRSKTELPAGTQTLFWNGTDAGGQQLSAGMYFLRLQINQVVSWRRISKL